MHASVPGTVGLCCGPMERSQSTLLRRWPEVLDGPGL